MKLNEIFFQTAVALAYHHANQSGNSPLTRDELKNYVIRYEERLTWKELDALFANLSEVDLSGLSRIKQKKYFRPFLDFLEERWKRLKKFPQLHYTNTYHTELTQICETLATELADTKVFFTWQ